MVAHSISFNLDCRQIMVSLLVYQIQLQIIALFWFLSALPWDDLSVQNPEFQFGFHHNIQYRIFAIVSPQYCLVILLQICILFWYKNFGFQLIKLKQSIAITTFQVSCQLEKGQIASGLLKPQRFRTKVNRCNHFFAKINICQAACRKPWKTFYSNLDNIIRALMLENVFMLGQRSTDNATIKLAAVQIEFQCLKAAAHRIILRNPSTIRSI